MHNGARVVVFVLALMNATHATSVGQLPSWLDTSLDDGLHSMRSPVIAAPDDELIVWGGEVGYRYESATNRWFRISGEGAHEAFESSWVDITFDEVLVWGGRLSSGTQQTTNEGAIYDVFTDSWRPVSTVGAPSPRVGATLSAITSGPGKVVVWGGRDSAGNPLGDGAVYDTATDSWTPMSTVGAPSAREGHSAMTIRFSTQVVIWGGGNDLADGAIYDVSTDSWSPMAPAPAGQGRAWHTAVPRSDNMYIVGGRGDGLFYDTDTDSWSVLSQVDAPTFSASTRADWVFGSSSYSGLYVWGGESGSGARYRSQSDTWEPLTEVNAPLGSQSHNVLEFDFSFFVWGDLNGRGARFDGQQGAWLDTEPDPVGAAQRNHVSEWTGSELLLWGGVYPTDGGGPNGYRYEPIADSWSPMSSVGEPAPRNFTASAWTGSELLVWGGQSTSASSIRYGDGGRYDPASDSWTPISTIGAPDARTHHRGVWTGSELIVWGGWTGTGRQMSDTGGRYDPATDSWTPTSQVNAPTQRRDFAMVWTGSRVLIWGGRDDDTGTDLSDGAAYDPATDTWTAIADASSVGLEGAVLGGYLWSGTELLIFGGLGGPGAVTLTNGGRYDPLTDSWSAMSTVGEPSHRRSAAVAWTGDEMIVYGGQQGSFSETLEYLADGALYHPASDSWRPLPETPRSGPRSLHTGTWAGDRFIVWGGRSDGDEHANGVVLTFVSPDDPDGDGVTGASDNCPLVSNPDQADGDLDGIGDACDFCALANPMGQLIRPWGRPMLESGWNSEAIFSVTDLDEPGRYEFYSYDRDSGTTTRLSPDLPVGGDVIAFRYLGSDEFLFSADSEVDGTYRLHFLDGNGTTTIVGPPMSEAGAQRIETIGGLVAYEALGRSIPLLDYRNDVVVRDLYEPLGADPDLEIWSWAGVDELYAVAHWYDVNVTPQDGSAMYLYDIETDQFHSALNADPETLFPIRNLTDSDDRGVFFHDALDPDQNPNNLRFLDAVSGTVTTVAPALGTTTRAEIQRLVTGTRVALQLFRGANYLDPAGDTLIVTLNTPGAPPATIYGPIVGHENLVLEEVRSVGIFEPAQILFADRRPASPAILAAPYGGSASVLFNAPTGIDLETRSVGDELLVRATDAGGVRRLFLLEEGQPAVDITASLLTDPAATGVIDDGPLPFDRYFRGTFTDAARADLYTYGTAAQVPQRVVPPNPVESIVEASAAYYITASGILHRHDGTPLSLPGEQVILSSVRGSSGRIWYETVNGATDPWGRALVDLWVLDLDEDGDGLPGACDPCPGDDDLYDPDGDLIPGCDNCPAIPNHDQLDSDGDGFGDACDTCLGVDNLDRDGDGICDSIDLCPAISDPDQLDGDGDGIGDACDACIVAGLGDLDLDEVCDADDNCPLDANVDQADGDGDGVGDLCECTDPGEQDLDNDGICDSVDNCPSVANPIQRDEDSDGLGDLCDPCVGFGNVDSDGDGLCDSQDNCPGTANPDQSDSDFDGVGDACDNCAGPGVEDTDGDEVCNGFDNCPDTPNGNQIDMDGDGFGDACDLCYGLDGDADSDGWCDDSDNCVFVPNNQVDSDGDGFGDACDGCFGAGDDDIDSDGFCGEDDNCPTVPNPDQTDSNGDGVGDACECGGASNPDTDSDGICDLSDNCPVVPNADQADADGDGLGDVCECGDQGLDDSDQDGSCDPSDNCPTTYNPTQRDDDGDGIGNPCDACFGAGIVDFDFDQYCDAADNCPVNYNPEQVDSDADGAGDFCDCQPSTPGGAQLDDIAQLELDKSAGSVAELSWESVPDAGTYSVIGGALSELASYGSCQVDELTATAWSDASLPAAGAGEFYLVVARSPICADSSLGNDSSGVARPAADCP